MKKEVDTAKHDDRLEHRALAYISTIVATSGEGGHNATFSAAMKLVHGFDLPTGVARRLLGRWNETNARPPWSPRELDHKISSAAKTAPVGAGNLPLRPGWLVREASPLESLPDHAVEPQPARAGCRRRPVVLRKPPWGSPHPGPNGHPPQPAENGAENAEKSQNWNFDDVLFGRDG